MAYVVERNFRLLNFKSRQSDRERNKMAGNQKLVVFNLAIIFPIFVLTIIFPIFVLAAPRDGSSPDLDIMEDLGARAADISIFMDDDEIEE